ncbi:MAG: CoA pyrophosphatase [Proteobacteria bacterium]|nr:CoA pyrophosphatase [Pseudomonadota bacterium]
MPERDAVVRAFGAFEGHTWPALPGRTNHLHAGVLVPVVWDQAPRILAIVRAAHLRRHAREVGFPGGKPEAEDADITATALREAREELGFEHIEVLGRLSSFPLYTSDYRLEPTVGLVSDQQLIPEPAEVAEVLSVDIRAWLAREQWEGVPFEHEGGVAVSPVFEIDGHLMYGGTAHVLYEAFTVLAAAMDTPLPALSGRRYTPTDILTRALRNA